MMCEDETGFYSLFMNYYVVMLIWILKIYLIVIYCVFIYSVFLYVIVVVCM